MKKLLNFKRLLKARNSSGFTLVEVIISCSLLSILVLGIMTFVTPVLKMLTSGQKNGRATMLAETLDTYISGVLRTAVRVEVFENVNCTQAETGMLTLSGVGSGIANIDEFMNGTTDGDPNSELYEVRALALMVNYSGSVTEQGVRLYNVPVTQTAPYACQPKDGELAFINMMFEGLYPIVRIETFLSEEDDVDESVGVRNANGYKISTKVYTDSKCYNADQTIRDKSMLVFEGITFFENLNMKTGASDINSVYTQDQINDAINAHEVVDGMLYYPATIIYYVAPKK